MSQIYKLFHVSFLVQGKLHFQNFCMTKKKKSDKNKHTPLVYNFFYIANTVTIVNVFKDIKYFITLIASIDLT